MSRSEWIEWDTFPDPPERRRKQKRIIEVLPPKQESEPRRVIVEVRHRRDADISWLWLVIAGAVLLLLWRPLTWLMLFALVGPDYW